MANSDFLSKQNALYISNTFESFMMDKYSFKYRDFINDRVYYKLLGDTIKNVYIRDSATKTIGQMNVVSISELKSYFIEHYIKSTPSIMDPVTEQPQLTTIVEDGDELGGIGEESEFFNKLQKLELNRKTFSGVGADTVSPPLPEQNNPTYAASVQIPSAITTVYMPLPIKIGKEIKIFSWQRDWVREKERNSFTWKGSLPKLTDRTNTRIGCMICQNRILYDTNIISLVIEGANEDEVSVTLIPSHSVGDYTIFRPILESLSYLKLLSLPWRISLETGDGEKIRLGSDGNRYTSLAMNGNNTTLSVVSDCEINDSVRLYNEHTKRFVATTVVGVGKDTIDVIGKIKDAGLLLNYSKQVSIVFETTTSEHKN